MRDEDVVMRMTVSPIAGMVNSFGLPRLMGPVSFRLVATRPTFGIVTVQGPPLPLAVPSGIWRNARSVGKFAALGASSCGKFNTLLRNLTTPIAITAGWDGWPRWSSKMWLLGS